MNIETILRKKLLDVQLSKGLIIYLNDLVEEYVEDLADILRFRFDNYNQLSEIQHLKKRKRIDLTLYKNLVGENLNTDYKFFIDGIRGYDQKYGNNSDMNKAGVYL